MIDAADADDNISLIFFVLNGCFFFAVTITERIIPAIRIIKPSV